MNKILAVTFALTVLSACGDGTAPREKRRDEYKTPHSEPPGSATIDPVSLAFPAADLTLLSRWGKGTTLGNDSWDLIETN